MESEGLKNESEKSETATGPEVSSNIAINPEECPKVNADSNDEEFSEEDFNFCANSSPESVVDDELEPCTQYYSTESGKDRPHEATSDDMELVSSFMDCADTENFVQFAWNCPYIFYSARELPTKAHEDVNYNLLQLATVLDKPLFCQLILNTLEHPQFSKRLFPYMPDDERLLQIKRLIGNYLNSISAETGDAPLHHAASFGYADCFKILMSHPLCNTLLLNNSGVTAHQILRKSDSPLAKLLTSGMQYVPIFRSNENLQPIVGEPISCNDFRSLDNVQDIEMEPMGRKRSFYFLSGFAGPMATKMANKFYKVLSATSSRSFFTPEDLEKIQSIKRLEPKRGLERIGRNLAKDWGVNWCEFFPFLEVYTNLATEEGLQILEKYFDGREKNLSYYRPLPSVDADPVTSTLMLARMFPIQDNPLKHKANTHYCYYKKFFGVIEDVAEHDEISYNLSPLFGSQQRPKQYNEKFINGSYLSELDEEMYISLKTFDDQYPHIQAWRREVETSIEEALRNNPDSMADNPLEPVPVPKVIISQVNNRNDNVESQDDEGEGIEGNRKPYSPLSKRKKL